MDKISEKEVIEEIKSVSQSIGAKVLTQKQFFSNSKITISDVLRYFPKWSDACKAAGVDYDRSRDKIPEEYLLKDWGRVARMKKDTPTLNVYKVKGKFSRNAFNRFGSWADVPGAFSKFFAGSDEWEDVLAILQIASPKTKRKKATHESRINQKGVTSRWPGKFDGRPTYGDPIDFRGLRHAPVNEQGVVFLFGMLARELGYLVEQIQSGFPDCRAKTQTSRGKWQDVSIEFEHLSKNFTEHPGHDPNKCDVIVCWIHNWQECPEHIKVEELSKLIKTLPKDE
jgi:hypothetical protein